MKKGKILKKGLAAVCLAACVTASCLGGYISAEAGISKVEVATDASIENGILSSVWLNVGNVKGERKKAVFDGDAAENARLIAVTKIKDIAKDGCIHNFEGRYKICIDDISENARFSFVFGLSKVLGVPGESGTTELCFVKVSGKLAVGIVTYDGGEKKEIVSSRSFAGVEFGKTLEVSCVIHNSALLVTIQPENGDSIVLSDENTPGNSILSEGYFAVGQTGRCNASLSSVSMDAWEYRNAETPDESSANEKFDGDAYNGNVWYSYATSSSDGGGVFVENNELIFRKVGEGFFGTRQQYSNFELTFDLVSLQREEEKDGAGKVLYSAEQGWFGVSFGHPIYNEKDFHTRTDCLFMLNSNGTVQCNSFGTPVASCKLGEAGTENFWDKKYDGRTVGFKLTVTDGVFTLSYRMGVMGAYKELMKRTTDITPYGYVRILASWASNMKFDNVSIVNCDANGIKTGTEYVKNVLPGTEHWAYEDTWQDEDLLPWAK